MKSYIPFTFSLGKEDADQKLLMIQQLKVRGNGRLPDAPRDLYAQAGSRGALLTWKMPESGTQWIRGWRVYKGTENNLYCEIHDPAQRQLYVELSSGTIPPVTNFFISSITAAGMESQKIPVQAMAATESGVPPIPLPPPGYTNEGSGGGDKTYYGGGNNPR